MAHFSHNLIMHFTKKRKALSGVIVTLIILVASVVLGTGVVLYGTNLFQTKSQSSAISVQGIRLWVNQTNPNGYGWGAVSIRVSGDTIISFDTITVRGQTIPYSNWFEDNDPARVTSANFQSSYNLTSMSPNGWVDGCLAATNNCGGDILVNPSTCNGAGLAANQAPYDSAPTTNQFILMQFGGGKPQMCLNTMSGPISLKPGSLALIYFKVPNGILTQLDAGSEVGVSLFAGKEGYQLDVPITTN